MRSRSLRLAFSARAAHAASERRQRSRTCSSVACSPSIRACSARARKKLRLVPRATGPDILFGLGLVRLLAASFLCGLQVHSRHLAASILLQLVTDALILTKRLHARVFDRADVHE